ncbi:MAG: antibiotic biosynthesis monooxygenase [Frankiales bacterium]|nr:antibiotic biosynthesis monooxygenase [Frankiales bacterium]
MVVEVALIDVTPGAEQAFSAAYAQARALIAGSAGCRSVRMTRGVETPTRFVLLVEWDSLAAHEEFRASPRFGDWRALIGPHFAEAPRVEHFEDL